MMLSFLLEVVLLKCGIIVGCGFVASRLMRGQSASLRYAVWAVVLAALLAVPILWIIGPTWSNAPIVEVRSTTSSLLLDRIPAAVPAPEGHAPRNPAPMVSRPVGVPVEVVSEPPALFDLGRVGEWLILVWLAGMMAALVRLGRGLSFVQRIRRVASPAPSFVRSEVAAAARRVGLAKAPRVVASARVRLPGTFGIWNPVVVLPVMASSWPIEELRAAILHELSHIRRRDCLVHLLSSLVSAVYWLNPLVWMVGQNLSREREFACDDGALGAGVEPVRYAEQLFRLAGGGAAPEPVLEPVLHLVNGSQLRRRVQAILSTQANRLRPTRGLLLSLTLATTVTIVPLTAIQVVSVDEKPASLKAQLERLDDADANVRRQAAWALGELEDARAVDALVDALADRDTRVRQVAAWALGEIKDRRAEQALLSLLDDPDARVREMAVLSLGEMRDPELIDPIRAAAERGLDAQARWALAEIRDPNPPEVWAGSLAESPVQRDAMDTYLAELGHSSAPVRAAAAEKLGRLGNAAAVEPLLDALEDPDAAVRAMAVWALDEINPSR